MEMEQTKRTQKNHHDLQTQVKRVRIYSKERQVDTKCKDLEIRVFLPPIPPPDLKKLILRPIPWKKVDVLVKKETELTKLQLLDQFMHSCVCGEIQLRKEQFINHINKKHEGMVPPRSQINEPPWINAVLFNSDEIEILYCQTTEDLT